MIKTYIALFRGISAGGDRSLEIGCEGG